MLDFETDMNCLILLIILVSLFYHFQDIYVLSFRISSNLHIKYHNGANNSTFLDTAMERVGRFNSASVKRCQRLHDPTLKNS